jgi:chemotaxis protein CheD
MSTSPRPRHTPDVGHLAVGVGEMKLATVPHATLAAFGLGSCIGVAFYDRVAKVAALLHAQLPFAADDEALADANPFAFVDSGIAETLTALTREGARRARLVVVAAGGATLTPNATVGVRNCAALEQTLRTFGLYVDAAHLGGNVPRSVSLALRDGVTVVRYPGSGTHRIGRRA